MQILMLEHNGWIPNNPNLPVLVYLNAIASQHIDLASQFEAAFSTNGWPLQWRNGVYGYHHYHAEGHEVLGIANGHARLMLGGPDGFVIQARAGDAFATRRHRSVQLELQRRLSGGLRLPGGTARGHLSRGTKQVATGED